MDLGLEGKACIVTGASKGIGAAVADLLAAEGAEVVAISRSGGDLALDVTDPDAADRVLDACPRPWALVNNAGGTEARPLEEVPDEEWQRQWELNVMAPMRLMRALAPVMAEAGGGRIVNVSSSAGKRPSGTLDAPYSVTKAAELSLSRWFADRWAAEGVLVNAVTPGPVATGAWLDDDGLAAQVAARSGSTKEDVLESTGGRAPLGRLSRPEEIAAAIVYLCSERASNVSGAAWSVDGGSVPLIV
jgi:3-oxoacyl-[acyl-carrier protein] reductase